jgi:hypothetical protein
LLRSSSQQQMMGADAIKQVSMSPESSAVIPDGLIIKGRAWDDGSSVSGHTSHPASEHGSGAAYSMIANEVRRQMCQG